jgi:polyisoprenoid-binding protein YceI
VAHAAIHFFQKVMNPMFARFSATVTAAFLFAFQAQAADWTIDPVQSSITFKGTHAGSAFSGRFSSWTGAITFDPAAPDAAKAVIDVDLATVSTDDATRYGTLPQPDWLDTATSPQAKFESTAVKAGAAAGEYVMSGNLTIRGVSVPLELPFKLAIDGNTARAEGSVTLKRLDFSIGKASDTPGQWVSLDIPVNFVVVATKK